MIEFNKELIERIAKALCDVPEEFTVYSTEKNKTKSETTKTLVCIAGIDRVERILESFLEPDIKCYICGGVFKRYIDEYEIDRLECEECGLVPAYDDVKNMACYKDDWRK